jgi:CDP-glucose 4,6-dehydratase
MGAGKPTVESLEGIIMAKKNSILSGKNVLVTGGAGFVGAHLVQRLLTDGAHVTSTYQTLQPHSYFMSHHLNEEVAMIMADVCDSKKMTHIVTKYNIEYIFHLAAQALVEPAYYNPYETLQTNIMGTVNILECARLYPHIKGVIVASSDKAYGKLEGRKKYKETDALRGDHPYEVSKSATDLIATSYFKTYGVPVVTTRFGNIYGEGDLNYSRIIPGFMEALVQKKTLELRSNGKFIRDYLYVKDVAEGYVLIAKNIKKVAGEAFNFSSADTHSVLDLIKILEKKLDAKIDYKILNSAKNEIPYQSLDYRKIQQKLKWKPLYNLKSTALPIYEWYRTALGAHHEELS